MRFFNVFKYLDNVVNALMAVSAYKAHRDESMLAAALAVEILEMVKETVGEDKMLGVDEDKVIEAVESVVDALEPVLGID